MLTTRRNTVPTLLVTVALIVVAGVWARRSVVSGLCTAEDGEQVR